MKELPETEVQAFLEACRLLRIDPSVALWEKRTELEVRSFYRFLPNRFLPEEKYGEFIAAVNGGTPNRDIEGRVRNFSVRRSFGRDIRITLERRQNFRCALCGAMLSSASSPQVDHIIPLALRGDNALSNLQLLCATCNAGKSSLLAWIAGNPFFSEGDGLSPKLRFCVLTRHRGECAVDDCDDTCLTSEMHVEPIVPIFRGGRFIFDNLQVLCQEHTEIQKTQVERAAQAAFQRPVDTGLSW